MACINNYTNLKTTYVYHVSIQSGDKYSSSSSSIFFIQVELERRNGVSRSDFSAMWWDYVEINGTSSYDAVIVIESVYDNANEIGIVETEFYIGEGSKPSSEAVAYSINSTRHIYIYFHKHCDTLSDTHVYPVTHKCVHYIYAIFSIHHKTSTYTHIYIYDCTLPPIYVYVYSTVYPNRYAHGFCFAVLCCGYTLTDFPISIRLISLALWQSNDCPSASKVTLMNMDKYFMWIHYERLYNHNKAKHNKTVCIFLGMYCRCSLSKTERHHTKRVYFLLYGLTNHPWVTTSICDLLVLWPQLHKTVLIHFANITKIGKIG